MSEIEKLYENAGVEKAPDINNCYPEMMKCHHCEHYKVIDEYTGRCLNEVYPEFTAEKQLKVLKILAYDDERYVSFGFDYGIWKINCHTEGYDAIRARCESFEEAVALLVNEQWLYLTDAEKAEIKRILK